MRRNERRGSPARRTRRPTFEWLEARWVTSTLSRPSARPAVSAPSVQLSADQGVMPMFPGPGLSGWKIPFDWGRAVNKNGQILLSGSQNFFLVSPRPYKNFVLQADVLIPTDGNSGLEFRSHYGHNFIDGYQADVDTGARNWAGGLWTQDRGWLVHPKHRAPVFPGRWNHYQVIAIGSHIQIAVNGVVTVDTYNNQFSDGYIGLQDHGTKGAVYHFRNVQIDDLGG